MLKDWIRYLIIFVVLAIAVCVALPQFYPEPPKKTWNDLEWFSFVASVLTIVGLVIAWTELKSNSKIVKEAKDGLLAYQKDVEAASLISEVDHIIDFATKKNMDNAFISFNFIHSRLEIRVNDDKLMKETYELLSTHRLSKNIPNKDKKEILEKLMAINEKLNPKVNNATRKNS